MTEDTVSPAVAPPPGRELFLKVLAGAMFLLFFQTFMVAPLIPTLAETFAVSRQTIGLLVPAYTVPYAFSALVCGAAADRIGRRGIFYASLAGFPLLNLAMAAALCLIAVAY